MKPIDLGDQCTKGSQLRADIVWSGEEIQNFNLAAYHLLKAHRILVIGTSLSVYPAAGLIHFAPKNAEKVIVSMDLAQGPEGFRWIRGNATKVVRLIVNQWLT